jgi:hypothetical protein
MQTVALPIINSVIIMAAEHSINGTGDEADRKATERRNRPNQQIGAYGEEQPA